MDYLIVSSLMLGLDPVNECHHFSCSILSFYVSTQLGQVLQLDSICFVWRLYSNSPLLIPDHYLYSDVLPFTSTWKMVKDTPNHIPMNMIGLAQTSREILDDGDIIIFPVIMIAPKALGPSVQTRDLSLLVLHYPPSAHRLIQSVYFRTFSDSMRH